jgi:hypothetical protein
MLPPTPTPPVTTKAPLDELTADVPAVTFTEPETRFGASSMLPEEFEMLDVLVKTPEFEVRGTV